MKSYNEGQPPSTPRLPSTSKRGQYPSFYAADPLEMPTGMTLDRDLEDVLMERALRFYDPSVTREREKCFLAGVELKRAKFAHTFTLEESMTELSELAGTAGLEVVGSTYQRVDTPDIQTFLGSGKIKEICKAMQALRCKTLVIDTELSPSQQHNIEDAFSALKVEFKVLDRTAVILDIFAQHARTREGQLQVSLALLSYRLPRLTRMWTHLERQSAAGGGKGMVGLRGPGERQLEVDRRLLRNKISILKHQIEALKSHRSMHRKRRKSLGLPVIALIGYTNAGKSSLLNTLTRAGVLAEDMLFATLDPTTRKVNLEGLHGHPEILMTDTVGFIQNIPTNLIAAFRATLEEVREADVLVHVCDVSNESWRKQEMAVLAELEAMGIRDKPMVTVWNKMDLCPTTKTFLQHQARKMDLTCAISAHTGEGLPDLIDTIGDALISTMVPIEAEIPYNQGNLLTKLHDMCVCDSVSYTDSGVHVRARVPIFLAKRMAPYLLRKPVSPITQTNVMYTEVVARRYLSADVDGFQDMTMEINYERYQTETHTYTNTDTHTFTRTDTHAHAHIHDVVLDMDMHLDMDEVSQAHTHTHSSFSDYLDVQENELAPAQDEDEDVMDFWRGVDDDETSGLDIPSRADLHWREVAKRRHERRMLHVPSMTSKDNRGK